MTKFISRLFLTFSFILCASFAFSLDKKSIPYYSLYNPELAMNWVYQNIEYRKDGSNTVVDIRGNTGTFVPNERLKVDNILSSEYGNCAEMAILLKYILDNDCFTGSMLIVTDSNHMVVYFNGKYYDCTVNKVYFSAQKKWGKLYTVYF